MYYKYMYIIYFLEFSFLGKGGEREVKSLNRNQLYVLVYVGKYYTYIMKFPDNVGIHCILKLYLSDGLYIAVFYTLKALNHVLDSTSLLTGVYEVQ